MFSGNRRRGRRPASRGDDQPSASYVGGLSHSTVSRRVRATAFTLAVVLASVVASCSTGRSGVEEAPPPLRPAEPELYGEGIFSTPAWDFFVAFTPDQRIAYICRANGTFTYFTILETYRRAGRWTEPRVAPFSGRWSDADPHIAPDGAWIYWISNRPLPTDSGEARTKARDDYDIWFAERLASGEWGAPRHLGSPVSAPGAVEWSPSVAANGNLYFGTVRGGGKGGNDIWMSRLANGVYQEPENLGDSVNTRYGEFEPWVAPDESYLIVSAQGRPDALGGFDLYISFRRNGVWQRLQHLPAPINSEHGDFNQSVSPDGRYLYFSSSRSTLDKIPPEPLSYRELQRRLTSIGNGLGDIYRVEMERLGVPRPAGVSP